MPISRNTRRYLYAALSLVVVAAAFWFILRHVNVSDALRALGKANKWWIAAAAGVNILTLFTQGERLFGLVRSVGDIKRRTAYEAVMIGFASSQLLPARGGEVVKLGVVRRGTSIPSTSLVGLITLENLLNGAGLIIVAVLLVMLGGAPRWVTQLSIGGAIVLPILLVLIYKLPAAKIEPDSSKWKAKVLDLHSKLHAGFAPIRNPRVILVGLGVTMLGRVLELGTAWLTLTAFHADPDLLMPLLLLLGVNAAILFPITPGQIGVYELAGAFVLQQLGMGASAAIMIALVYHLVHMLSTLALASVFLVVRQFRT